MIASRRERWLLGLTLLAVGGFALDGLWLSPLLTRQDQVDKKVAEAILREQKANLAVARGPAIERELAAVEQTLQNLTAESAVLEFDKHLSSLATTAGATTGKAAHESTEKLVGYDQLTYRLDLTTTIEALQSYLFALDTSALPLKISSLTIAPQPKGEALTVTMRVSTLTLPGRARGGPSR